MDKASNNKVKPITLEEVKKACNHVGFISAPAQSLFVTDLQILIICTTSCNRCGHLFTTMNPISMQGPGTLAVPSSKIDPGIFTKK